MERTEDHVDLIPLAKAFLCANCENVTEVRAGKCRGCGSDSVISLARVLNRESEVAA